MKPGENPKAVLVEWIDSGMAHDNGWESATSIIEHMEQSENMLIVKSVGWLLEDNDKYLLIGQSWDRHNDKYVGAQVVYRPCVRKVEVL